ncbi:MAG: alpha/beta hydrolase family esterase [Bradymonadia bacterium]
MTVRLGFYLICCVALFGCDTDDENGGTLVFVSDAGGDVDAVVDGGRQPDSDCAWSNNGVCDEPSRCPLGSDEADCVSACESMPEMRPFIAAACIHRGLLQQAPEMATDGDVHVGVGRWIDESLPAPVPDAAPRSRRFRIFVPPGLDPDRPRPAIFMLPGNRVSHYSLPDYTELDSSAASNGFIVVYVEQPWRDRFFSWSWYTDWDWAGAPQSNPDVSFLTSLAEYMVDAWLVDADRIYLAGHSRGAAMSVIAALERPDVFAGAIPQSGFVEFGYFDRLANWSGARRPAFFFMHGTLDDDVCIDCEPGGRCGVNPVRQCGTVAATDRIVATLQSLGWEDETLHYKRLEGVAHRYQPWLNQQAWDFVKAHASGGETP